MLFNVACAYGQAHRWLTEGQPGRTLKAGELYYEDNPPVNPEARVELEQIVSFAVGALNVAIERDERYRAKLEMMINSADPNYDDFASLRDDVRIRELVGKKKAA
jgi:hypothetical protein